MTQAITLERIVDRLAGKAVIEAALTALTLCSIAASLLLVALGHEHARGPVLGEIALAVVLLGAWGIRATGRPRLAAVVTASALLLAGVVIGSGFAEDFGVVLLPVVAFLIVIPHLRGRLLGAFAAASLLTSGVSTAIQISAIPSTTEIEVPIIAVGTVLVVALVIGAIWVVYRRAEAVGREHQELLLRLPVAIVKVAQDGTVLSANPAYAASFGSEPGPLLEALLAAMGGAAPDSVRTGLLDVTLSGRRRRVGHRTRAVLDGGVTYYDSALEDVSSLYEARDLGALLTSVADATPDAMAIVAPDGTMLWCNATAARILGQPRESVVGTQVTELQFVTPDDVEIFRRALAGEQTPTSTTRVADKHGQVIFSLTAAPVRDADGAITAVAFTGRDITEAQTLARREGEIEAQVLGGLKIDALSRVISSAARDVGDITPAAGEDLGRRTSTGRRRGDGASHLDEARIREAARALAAYSAAPRSAPAAVLDDVVSGAERMLRQIVPRPILLEVQLDAMESVGLTAVELEEILATLVVNAVDAIAGAGHIRIATRVERTGRESVPWAVLEVADDGAGMTSEVLERAFEPYFTTKAPGVGTGLGLTSAQRVVADAGGILVLESEPGRGTLVRVLLPTYSDTARQAITGG